MAQRPKQKRRRFQSQRYPKGTLEREARDELERVTWPDPSGETWSGQPRMLSYANQDLSKRIFSALRPDVWALPPWSRNPSDEDHALPPVPATFTPSPLVVGQDAAKLFEQFSAINPEVRRTMRSITTGPESGYMNWILSHGDPRWLGNERNALPRWTPNTDRWGHVTSTDMTQHGQYRDMYLSPFLNQQDLRETMGHELGHVLLGNSETWANRLEALLREIHPRYRPLDSFDRRREFGIVFGPRIEDVK